MTKTKRVMLSGGELLAGVETSLHLQQSKADEYHSPLPPCSTAKRGASSSEAGCAMHRAASLWCMVVKPEKEVETADYAEIRRWQKVTMPGIRIIYPIKQRTCSVNIFICVICNLRLKFFPTLSSVPPTALTCGVPRQSRSMFRRVRWLP